MLQKRSLITALLTVPAVVFLVSPAYSVASGSHDAPFELSGTMWETAALGYRATPELLYAIALQESRKATGGGLAAPDPYVLRYGNQVQRFESYIEAKTALDALTADPTTNLKRLDIGIMQINAGWHRERVEELGDLLVPGIAAHVAAQLLDEIATHTDDPVSWIGRYHSYTPELTYTYGTSVQRIYCGLVRNRDLDVCGGTYGTK